MRRLLLLRHAKSDWPDGVADIDRPLNARGRAAAPRMAAYIAAEGLTPAHVFVSPARRTAETWERMAPALPGLQAETVPSLYEAPGSRILDAIRTAPEAAASLMVIGHNPGLGSLASQLAGEGSARLIAEMQQKFPTAALALLDFPVETWAAIGRRGGRLERFVGPRGLAEQASR